MKEIKIMWIVQEEIKVKGVIPSNESDLHNLTY